MASASPRLAAWSRRASLWGWAPALAAVTLGVGLALAPFGFAERARNLAFDEYQRLWPRAWSADTPVRILDIDEASLAAYGQWPWPRAQLAAITARLAEHGAAAVAFDTLLAEPERGAAGPDPLAAALGPARATLALALRSDGGPAPTVKAGFVTVGDDPRAFLPRFDGAANPLPALAAAAPGLGAINFLPDRDLVVRTAPLAFVAGAAPGGELAPSLDLETLRLAQSTGTIAIKTSNASDTRAFGARSGVVAIRVGQIVAATERNGALRIRYAGTQPGRRISAARLLAGETLRNEIDGRIVLVGVSAAALGDIRSTPLEGAVPGVDIHAEILETLLTNATLARPDYAPGLEAALVVVGGLAMAWVARAAPPARAIALAAAALAGLFAASAAAFVTADLLIDPLAPGVAWTGAFAAMTLARFRTVERERRAVREAFSRYLSPDVVARLAADPRQVRLGGELRATTVLFSDVRDFTARSETLSAEEVVAFLNALLTPLTDCVLAEGGTIDKYLGDGVMAFWNAPLDQPDHAARACRAALAMQAAIPALDARLRAASVAAGRPYTPLRIGVGVQTGSGFVGNMGSARRFDYSVVGDVVNTAARLEAATKTFGVPIIVSQDTRDQAADFLFVDLGPVALKGKAARAHLFALHGGPHDRSGAFDAFSAAHDHALSAALDDGADLDAACAAVERHPMAERYAAFYTILRARRRGDDAAIVRGDE